MSTICVIALVRLKKAKKAIAISNDNVINFTFEVVVACFVGFAHGSNDVANAIGPLAAVINVLQSGAIESVIGVPLWLVVLGGAGIVVGLATWGYKVIGTIGRKITEITPTRGFSAEFSTALVVLVCSRLGLPVSTF